jgi:hypothetical protein
MDWTDRRECEGIGQDANGLTDRFGDFRIESAQMGSSFHILTQFAAKNPLVRQSRRESVKRASVSTLKLRNMTNS